MCSVINSFITDKYIAKSHVGVEKVIDKEEDCSKGDNGDSGDTVFI